MNFFCQDGRIGGNCPVTSTLHIFFMIKCNFVIKSIIKYFKNVGEVIEFGVILVDSEYFCSRTQEMTRFIVFEHLIHVSHGEVPA